MPNRVSEGKPPGGSDVECEPVVGSYEPRFEQVHRRAPDEAPHNKVVGQVAEVVWRVDLCDTPLSKTATR